MASVKVKFRPSTIAGKEGTIYYQIIQNRVKTNIQNVYTYKVLIYKGIILAHIIVYIATQILTNLWYFKIKCDTILTLLVNR